MSAPDVDDRAVRVRGWTGSLEGFRHWVRVRHRRMHSLRAKLTLVNLLLLLLGVAAATVVSLLAMQHYLVQRVDGELLASREAVQQTDFTQEDLNQLQAISTLLEHVASPRDPESTGLPRPGTILVALDAGMRPTPFATHEPSGRQLELAAAVGDAAGFAASGQVRDVEVDGDPYRVVAGALRDGSVLLLAADVEAVRSGIHQALKVDLAFGGLLLCLLALVTMKSTKHLVRPLEGMVETASAIAEGDLARRVPAGRHPVNEIEQLRVALNSMLHQVESAFETRERSATQLRRFVADASHELRTPLAAIQGYLQLYDRGMLRSPAERERALARMTAEAERMGRLVSELLTLARLDGLEGRPEVHRLAPVDLGRLARDATDDLAAQQRERRVAVREEDGPAFVLGDEATLRQLVGNLLANVRVHTPVDADVTVELSSAPDGAVRLRVADEGPGMAPDDADRIFDRFFRAGGGVGSGLGMSIVRAAADAHAATVEVTTAPGRGLAVVVTFPAGGRFAP
ncbi:HAMP domain-containing sensor histidine kinase [Streptomyces sp. NPDC048057]|uniref:sensor histidine kinase n=1 Tax=Streptomyces sp. NPDC048057 TaxID=3155628 RepID=UPI0033FEB651